MLCLIDSSWPYAVEAKDGTAPWADSQHLFFHQHCFLQRGLCVHCVCSHMVQLLCTLCVCSHTGQLLCALFVCSHMVQPLRTLCVCSLCVHCVFSHTGQPLSTLCMCSPQCSLYDWSVLSPKGFGDAGHRFKPSFYRTSKIFLDTPFLLLSFTAGLGSSLK